jgi:RNA polymerase primary sigma factor
MEVSDNIHNDYIREVHKSDYDILSNKELREKIALAQAGCEKSREEVIHANLRLVYLTLFKYVKVPKHIYMDCVQAGHIALMDSVDKYRVDSPAHFATYALKAIRRKVWREIRVSGSTIILPQQKVSKRSKAEDEIYQNEGALDILLSGDYVPVHGVVSMDASYDNGEEVCNVPSKDIMFTSDTPLSKLSQLEDYGKVRKALECLDERERKIIEGRFLTHSSTKKTLDKLSREILVTRERIRQIEKIALIKLKKELDKEFI